MVKQQNECLSLLIHLATWIYDLEHFGKNLKMNLNIGTLSN